MAKPISDHSFWLPGFDPEQPPSPALVPHAPEPPVAARSTAPDTTIVPAPATAIPEVAVAPEIPATSRSNWRSRTSTPAEPARPLWAPLSGLDIPAGPLEAALTAFAKAAGVLLIYPPALVQGQQSPGLSGSHTPAEALDKLLAGTGLQAVIAENGTYTLRRQAAPTTSDRPAAAIL